MVVRRVLLATLAIFFLFGAPAGAQSYGDVLDTGQQGGATVRAAGTGIVSATATGTTEANEGSLARTGSDNIQAFAQVATVLIGCGVLLVVTARRRRGTRASLPA